MSTRGKGARFARIAGNYSLPGGRSTVGELKLRGSGSLLKVYSDSELGRMTPGFSVRGTAYTGERVTLVDCDSPGMGQTRHGDNTVLYHAEIFPHYVAVGSHHLGVSQPNIKAIHFTTTDLPHLFYDFDAFSQVIEAKAIIDVVLQERRELRPVEAGEWPLVQYFTGRECITEVPTSIGKVSVNHRPRHNMGGPVGVFIKNRIVVTIEPEQPVELADAVDRMYDVACFLSMAAGRVQGVNQISVSTTDVADGMPQLLTIHPTYRWKASAKSRQHRPHPGDVPLDAIRRRAEFDAVLKDWTTRHRGWAVARRRYLECMRRGNEYGSERLVAAANLFDILPEDSVPPPGTLADDLAATRDACVRMFREHPPSVDRDSALSALGRLGQPSLPKKVTHRASIVESTLGSRFPKLQFVAKVAVKVRNFFVHGSTDGIDYLKVEPLVPFLTDTLEFIFAASDFIDASWDAVRWNSEAHGWGHTFARYRSEYAGGLAELERRTGVDTSPA